MNANPSYGTSKNPNVYFERDALRVEAQVHRRVVSSVWASTCASPSKTRRGIYRGYGLAELKGGGGTHHWKVDLLYPVREEDGNTLPCITRGRS